MPRGLRWLRRWWWLALILWPLALILGVLVWTETDPLAEPIELEINPVARVVDGGLVWLIVEIKNEGNRSVRLEKRVGKDTYESQELPLLVEIEQIDFTPQNLSNTSRVAFLPVGDGLRSGLLLESVGAYDSDYVVRLIATVSVPDTRRFRVGSWLLDLCDSVGLPEPGWLAEWTRKPWQPSAVSSEPVQLGHLPVFPGSDLPEETFVFEVEK